MQIIDQMTVEANKLAIKISMDCAKEKLKNYSTLRGNCLSGAVAHFKHAGFTMAGTDCKYVEGSSQEVVLCNDENVLVVIASQMNDKPVTTINVTPLK